MKRLIETIKNIFKIEELRKRILFTLSLILVYRFGSFVVIPGSIRKPSRTCRVRSAATDCSAC